MQLLAPAAFHLISSGVNVLNISDRRIVQNTIDILGGRPPNPEIKGDTGVPGKDPELLAALRNRYGDDLQSKKFNGHTFCEFVKIYAKHNENLDLFECFLLRKIDSHLKKSVNSEPAKNLERRIIRDSIIQGRSLTDVANEILQQDGTEAALELTKPYLSNLGIIVDEIRTSSLYIYDQFIFAARETARAYPDARLHDKTLKGLVIAEKLGRKDVPKISDLINKFSKNDASTTDIVREIFGDKADEIIVSTIIEAAEIERRFSREYSNPAASEIIGEMEMFISKLYKEEKNLVMLNDAEAVLLGLEAEYGERVAAWRETAKAEKLGDLLAIVRYVLQDIKLHHEQNRGDMDLILKDSANAAIG